jgi:hypothetical protein
MNLLTLGLGFVSQPILPLLYILDIDFHELAFG